ncbi:glycosyltransferase family 4 protein [Gephyromycinifex aptenodytis]|uniref:glycosyltransferase family 4 protein n=1 Tax=Gephyromycinifex aptenodytis TaxID=2716227 RepID=UPI001445FC43|nr:glycosyltransferase family 4 protein [Gephyromycinifex aptenodytis]
MSGLRVALLSYRSKPHCGGQGVYVRNLSRELAALGHEVTVFSGQPYPELDRLGEGVTLEKLPSLDLYREPDPFRIPHLREYRDLVDLVEVGGMLTATFPEPLTFSLRAARALRAQAHRFDVVHDNQSLGYGLLSLPRLGLPVVATIHHPITRDLQTDLSGAQTWLRRLSLRRWYAFLTMQKRVARAQQRILTVSQSSATDIAHDFGVDPERITVVPLGVDTEVFTPRRSQDRVPGRVVAMASADTPLKGIDVLLEAIAQRRAEHLGADTPLELVLVSATRPGGRTERLLDELRLRDVVRVVGGLSDAELADLVASAQVACVPSRYEGFSLPTVEAMACGTPLVVSRAGALPEVVGEPGSDCALVVEPGDATALCAALSRLLDDPDLRLRLGEAGRARACARYSWPAVARATAQLYREAMGSAPVPYRVHARNWPKLTRLRARAPQKSTVPSPMGSSC